MICCWSPLVLRRARSRHYITSFEMSRKSLCTAPDRVNRNIMGDWRGRCWPNQELCVHIRVGNTGWKRASRVRKVRNIHCLGTHPKPEKTEGKIRRVSDPHQLARPSIHWSNQLRAEPFTRDSPSWTHVSCYASPRHTMPFLTGLSGFLRWTYTFDPTCMEPAAFPVDVGLVMRGDRGAGSWAEL